MKISRRIKKVDHELSFKKLKEELNKALSDFERDILDIIEIIRDIKISFESSLSEIFNPYGPSVERIYEIKETFERLETGLVLDIESTFYSTKFLMEMSLSIMEKEKFSDEDYKASLYEFFKFSLKSVFLTEIYPKLSDYILFGKNLLKKIADFVENLGNKEGLFRDKFKILSSDIDEMVKKSKEITNNIIEAKKKAESILIEIIRESYSKGSPEKLLRSIYDVLKDVRAPVA